jgi:hypothetical protein
MAEDCPSTSSRTPQGSRYHPGPSDPPPAIPIEESDGSSIRAAPRPFSKNKQVPVS